MYMRGGDFRPIPPALVAVDQKSEDPLLFIFPFCSPPSSSFIKKHPRSDVAYESSQSSGKGILLLPYCSGVASDWPRKSTGSRASISDDMKIVTPRPQCSV